MKPNPSPSASSPPADPILAWNVAADLTRQQLAVATEGARAMFRGFDVMQKIQEKTAQAASSRHAAVEAQLRGSRHPAELLQLQSELMRFDMENAANYWQQLTAATLEMQTEILGCATHLLDSDALLESASALKAMQSAVPALQNSFFAVKSIPGRATALRAPERR
jgi:phasin protein